MEGKGEVCGLEAGRRGGEVEKGCGGGVVAGVCAVRGENERIAIGWVGGLERGG